jgi:hypothetical protein
VAGCGALADCKVAGCGALADCKVLGVRQWLTACEAVAVAA